MIKVVIADDEVRICQLICALADWDELGMKVAGMAHNGLEAIEMVRTQQPEILITDIRMPSCSGLELVEQVKRELPGLEIIIISGYAHFEYAQQAIKYGVGDYLLKPVSKSELKMTLEKLRIRICRQRETQLDQMKMQQRTEQDIRLLQANLIAALMNQNSPELTEESLRNTYGLQVQPGLYQAVLMKLDSGKEAMSPTSTALLMEKAKETLERVLCGKCSEYLLEVRGLVCAGILNYEEVQREAIRRALKTGISQMEMQKSLFRPVAFSVALGSAEKSPQGLQDSMRKASLLIEERLMQGTGRLFEHSIEPSGGSVNGILNRYLREMSHAAEIKSMDLLEESLRVFEEELFHAGNLRGYEIADAVYSAAEMFAVKAKLTDRTECIRSLREQYERCGSAEEVFSCLRSMETEVLSRQIKEQEDEAVRPIRRAKQYIQEHYSEPIMQEEVSGAVGLSSTYFSALFKKTEGEGFAKYLIGVRMEQARLLLRESSLSVSEICRKVGYNDLKHFTRTFEKTAGVKPSVYRKLYG